MYGQSKEGVLFPAPLISATAEAISVLGCLYQAQY